MLSCKEVVRILASGEKLSFKQRMGLLVHLFMCKHCARYSRQLKMLKQGLVVLFKGKTNLDPQVVRDLESKIIDSVCKK